MKKIYEVDKFVLNNLDEIFKRLPTPSTINVITI